MYRLIACLLALGLLVSSAYAGGSCNNQAAPQQAQPAPQQALAPQLPPTRQTSQLGTLANTMIAAVQNPQPQPVLVAQPTCNKCSGGLLSKLLGPKNETVVKTTTVTRSRLAVQ